MFRGSRQMFTARDGGKMALLVVKAADSGPLLETNMPVMNRVYFCNYKINFNHFVVIIKGILVKFVQMCISIFMYFLYTYLHI